MFHINIEGKQQPYFLYEILLDFHYIYIVGLFVKYIICLYNISPQ